MFSRNVIKSAKSAVQSKLSQKKFPKFDWSAVRLFILETNSEPIFVHIEAILEEYFSKSSADNIYCEGRGGPEREKEEKKKTNLLVATAEHRQLLDFSEGDKDYDQPQW